MPHEESPAVTGPSTLGSAAKQPSCAASMPEPESAVTRARHQLAAEQAQPTNHSCASAWTFSSYLEGRNAGTFRWFEWGHTFRRSLERRITRHEVRNADLRAAPPEVLHRYVQGHGDVVQRRLR